MTTASLPPGSLGLPVLGELLPFAANPTAFLESRFKKYGPVFKTRLFGEPTACFVGPDAFGVFLDEKYFTRDSASPPSIKKLLSPGAVPFLDGAAHKTRKHLLMQAVGPAALPNYVPVMHNICQSRLARWAKKPEIRWTDEMAEMCFAITETLFAGGNPDAPDATLRAAFDLFNIGFFAPPIELPFTAFTKALKARDTMMDIFRSRVASHKANPKTDVMSALLKAEENGNKLSDEEVAMETLHFFFAAYAGMCGFLRNMCLAFTQNPQIRERAASEVRTWQAGPWTMETLNSAPYLDQVVREVKRFYPVIPLTFFARAKTDVPVNGFVIPAGWKAFGCTFATINDPKTWKNPELFDPDRFGPGREEHKSSPHAFVPQGGGPVDGHRCAGEVLSTVLMKTFAAELLRGYEWNAPSQNFEFNMSSVPPGPKDLLRATVKTQAARPG